MTCLEDIRPELSRDREGPGAREAIESFGQQLQRTRRLFREQGDDPPEIKGWLSSARESAGT